MRPLLAVALPVAAALVQVTLVRFVVVGEARPDLVALVVLCWCLAAGASEGIWWAFAGGLSADLLGSPAFGATTVSLLPIALAYGLREAPLAEPRVAVGAALVGVGAFAHTALLALVVGLAGFALPAAGEVAVVAAGSGLYTGALALAVYPLIRLVHRRTRKQPAFG